MRIGIIEGSVRQGRVSTSVAGWVAEQARERTDAEYVVIRLADFVMPFMDTEKPPAALGKQYPYPEVQRWSDEIDACDAIILVTPEYNHGVPGALKNATDWLGPELQGKSAALVSYGADKGVRAVEQWRQILANFNMHVIRTQLSLDLFAEFGEQGAAPSARRPQEVQALFAQLEESAARRG